MALDYTIIGERLKKARIKIPLLEILLYKSID